MCTNKASVSRLQTIEYRVLFSPGKRQCYLYVKDVVRTEINTEFQGPYSVLQYIDPSTVGLHLSVFIPIYCKRISQPTKQRCSENIGFRTISGMKKILSINQWFKIVHLCFWSGCGDTWAESCTPNRLRSISRTNKRNSAGVVVVIYQATAFRNVQRDHLQHIGMLTDYPVCEKI